MNLYDVSKIINPITTTAKPGINVQELVRSTYPKVYACLLLDTFDWQNDLNGILDFLYGERHLGIFRYGTDVKKDDISAVIELIEKNCEIK